MKARRITVVIALVASSLFALSVSAWMGQWWTVGEVSIGPLGARHCFNQDCRRTGLAWIGGSDLWMRSATATWVAGLVAMFVLAGVAAWLAAGKVPRLLAQVSIVALATAVVTAAYFVAKFPGLNGASIGQGMIMYGVAIVIGCVPAIAVLRAR